MPSSQALYLVTITNGNAGTTPNDGFVDHRRVQDYGVALDEEPAGFSLALAEAKARGNFRYRDIIAQLGRVSNCYVMFQIPGLADPVENDGDLTTEGTEFIFYILVEHGVDSLITRDEYNSGALLTGTLCIRRCVARALLNHAFRTVEVFDSSNSQSTPNTTTDVTRYGPRIVPNFEIGPYATSINNANTNISVAAVVF